MSQTSKNSVASSADVWAIRGYNAQVFITSACVMAMELVASRLISRTVGSSLYAWTSVIGVVLAGVTLGNFLGGYLADRPQRGRSVARLYLFASIACASVIWFDQMLTSLSRPSFLDWPLWIASLVAFVFLVPSLALGSISPLIASLAVVRSRQVGTTVGNVYAWGTLGSILGTFVTGFYLIDLWGTDIVIGAAAGALGTLGLLTARQSRPLRLGIAFVWLPLLVIVVVLATCTGSAVKSVTGLVGTIVTGFRADDAGQEQRRGWERLGEVVGNTVHRWGLFLLFRTDEVGAYYDESNYSTIIVSDSIEKGRPIKLLRLNNLIHSYYDPAEPTRLEYDYERVYAEVTRLTASQRNLGGQQKSTDPTALFLGGGGYIFPRWFLKHFPDTPRVEVAEIDPAVYAVTIKALGLTPAEQERIKTYIEDARNFADDRLRENQRLVDQGKSPVRYDFIYCDAFNDFSIPAHLTTREFMVKVHDLLNDRGVLQANIIDIFPRIEYPGVTQGEAEIDYEGRLPAVLEKADIGETDFKRLSGRFEALEIKAMGKHCFRLRATRTLSITDQNRLGGTNWAQQAKRPVANDFLTEEPQTWWPAMESLAALTRRPKSYSGKLPAALQSLSGPAQTWVPAAAPLECVEVSRTTDGRVLLGFRGKIGQSLEQQLKDADPDNREWIEAVTSASQRSRRPGGGRFMGRYVATAAEVFPFIYLYSTSAFQPEGDRDTYVMVCSRRPLELTKHGTTADWRGDWFAALESVEGESKPRLKGQMSSILSLAEGQILTDDYAPVDNLLKAVFAEQD